MIAASPWRYVANSAAGFDYRNRSVVFVMCSGEEIKTCVSVPVLRRCVKDAAAHGCSAVVHRDDQAVTIQPLGGDQDWVRLTIRDTRGERMIVFLADEFESLYEATRYS